MDYKEKVIALLNSEELSKEQKEKLESIFPELKESEDEKIRKWLIGCLEYRILNTGVIEEKENCKKAIAWLEKQGEQKPTEVRTTGYWNVQEVEQNSTDEIGNYDHEKVLQAIINEQKPAWSEEDDIMAHDIDYAIKCQITYPKSRLSSMSSWIYGLKDRVQPKQEWSEKDESILFRIINDLKFLRDTVSIDPKYAVNTIDIEREINWLKSFRPQNMWISVDEKVYVQKPVLAQKKDKLDQFKGYVVCCDHTLTPNAYERYMILDNIVSQNT